MSILEKIHGHKDLVTLNAAERSQLCQELRRFLISTVSKTGGHVASNLGVVELTVAIETVFDTGKDRLVFDVGHQSYIHKMLTDRRADFHTLRQFGGMAGFPKPSESNTDAFVAGHASSSVSIALGMARARTLRKEDYSVVALLGDGAATGGIAYEGLNDAAVSKEPIVIVLNDNTMSIDRNVGGMASHLRQLRTKEKYLGMKHFSKTVLSHIPGGQVIYRFLSTIKNKLRLMLLPATIFDSMGFVYLGPVDGHDTENLIMLLNVAKSMQRPVVLHVVTQKGKGYAPAQEHPKLFHGIGRFDFQTGEPIKNSGQTYSEAFGSAMVDLAGKHDHLCAITAAMPGGTGLLEFKKTYPDRLFDVGIAEEHAVSMAGGLAKQGMIPVVAIYSTFLQRAYDMIIQDICMLHLHVVFAVDRAGLVGEDGETHHGIYDVGFLRHAPGLTVLCPASYLELQQMLRWAVEEQDGPVAIRYPRGSDNGSAEAQWGLAEDGVTCCGSDAEVSLVTYGSLLSNAEEAAEILRNHGIDAGIVRLLKLAPLPIESIAKQLATGATVVVLEETGANCGICQELSFGLRHLRPDCKVYGIDLGDQYVTHGSIQNLYEHYGLSGHKIAEFVMEVHRVEN
ncbi:MAG: 1-deoxy-D-xylulose-5-phosphate synthase [Oscillospiraceae bacterium]|nr:1-deoxy-D-xylulose-5-phosphate synthase [Oscillospiraceae bacterium]